MPCDSSHMKPHTWEIEASRIMYFLAEVNRNKRDISWLEGFHPDIYCEPVSKDIVDFLTRSLCRTLKQKDATKYSLELQIWYRDHCKWDRKNNRT